MNKSKVVKERRKCSLVQQKLCYIIVRNKAEFQGSLTTKQRKLVIMR